ncbi:MBL fold metallo-hydrolase [Streptomyces fradiae]|uniref:MBL fold metallo-hydrolase n=1 Tax=Streptomyces fradiae TaxID=1906 RepID=UPI002941D70D|nr:MBL fold metallo-hydrolase [Streptomyces fradiae]WOI60947.1 MBL fold metallo-hydrolase [Streptomyces fradiae]
MVFWPRNALTGIAYISHVRGPHADHTGSAHLLHLRNRRRMPGCRPRAGLLREPVEPARQEQACDQLLSNVSAIVITHSHCDHFHPPTFLHFGKQTPVVIPAADRNVEYPMAKELAEHGFSNVIEIEAGETVTLSGLRITSIAAPNSIEGIAQQSILIDDGKNRILHGADTLEDFETFERLREEGPIRLALLPLNCSLNYQNLRNQMSPGTWLEAAAVLRPEAMVPLGINEVSAGASQPSTPPGSRTAKRCTGTGTC